MKHTCWNVVVNSHRRITTSEVQRRRLKRKKRLPKKCRFLQEHESIPLKNVCLRRGIQVRQGIQDVEGPEEVLELM